MGMDRTERPVEPVGERPVDGMGFKEAGLSPTGLPRDDDEPFPRERPGTAG